MSDAYAIFQSKGHGKALAQQRFSDLRCPVLHQILRFDAAAHEELSSLRALYDWRPIELPSQQELDEAREMIRESGILDEVEER